MRDINRIKPFLDELCAFWELNPDLRFGQMIYVLAQYLNCGDIFFPEDEKWLEAIENSKIARF